jgi:hypothetical protein
VDVESVHFVISFPFLVRNMQQSLNIEQLFDDIMLYQKSPGLKAQLEVFQTGSHKLDACGAIALYTYTILLTSPTRILVWIARHAGIAHTIAASVPTAHLTTTTTIQEIC